MSIVVQDPFTDTAGVNLSSHLPTIGPGYSKVGGYSGDMVITAGGRVRPDTSGGTGALYEVNGMLNNAEYDIDFDFYCMTPISGQYYNIVGRATGGNNDGYRIEIDTGIPGILFFETIGGSNNTLGGVGYAFSAATLYQCRLRLWDGFKQFYIQGAPQFTPATSNNIVGPGTARLFSFTGTAPTDSTGFHYDNLIVNTLNRSRPFPHSHTRVQIYPRKRRVA